MVLLQKRTAVRNKSRNKVIQISNVQVFSMVVLKKLKSLGRNIIFCVSEWRDLLQIHLLRRGICWLSMQANNIVVTDGKMCNSKSKIPCRERNSDNKRPCFLSFMHYLNFQSSLQWNSFQKQSILVNLPISTHQQDKNTFFFFSLVGMHALYVGNIENHTNVLSSVMEKSRYISSKTNILSSYLILSSSSLIAKHIMIHWDFFADFSFLMSFVNFLTFACTV